MYLPFYLVMVKSESELKDPNRRLVTPSDMPNTVDKVLTATGNLLL